MPKIDIELLEQFTPMFFDFEGRFVHLLGSAGSAKSYHACMYLLHIMLKHKNTQALMVRRLEKDIRESIWGQCQKIAHKVGLEKYFRFYRNPLAIECKASNSRAIAVGCDNIVNLKSVAEATFALIDEADLIKAEDFDMIVGRVRSKFADLRQIVLCYNPPVRQHWLPQRFFQGGKIMPEFNKPYYFSQPYTNPFTNKTEHLHSMAIRTHYRNNIHLDAETAGYYQSLKETNPEMYISLDRAEWGDNAIGIIFNKKYYDEKQAPAGITGVIYCDPNIGLKEQADTTAIVKIGFDWNTETFYVVDAFCERVSDSTVTLDRAMEK